MSQSYSKRDLYGGAITVDLPSDYVDASDLRQIPDHQEVYLSSTTLTSVIFEINGFATDIPSSSQVTSTTASHAGPGPDHLGMSVAAYHFEDALDTGDSFLNNQITTQGVALASPSLKKFPSFVSSGTIMSSEVDKKAKPAGALPSEWQATRPTTTTEVRAWQVLVRMQEYGTDLCARINVPMKEFQKQGEAGAQRGKAEQMLGEDIVKQVIQTLEVTDFGLFAGDE